MISLFLYTGYITMAVFEINSTDKTISIIIGMLQPTRMYS